jgi:hypothetical protein
MDDIRNMMQRMRDAQDRRDTQARTDRALFESLQSAVAHGNVRQVRDMLLKLATFPVRPTSGMCTECLFQAIDSNNCQLVNEFLTEPLQRADPVTRIHKTTCLLHASKVGCAVCVHFLLESAKVQRAVFKDKDLAPKLLRAAAKYGSLSVIRELFKTFSVYDLSVRKVWEWAVLAGRSEVLEKIMSLAFSIPHPYYDSWDKLMDIQYVLYLTIEHRQEHCLAVCLPFIHFADFSDLMGAVRRCIKDGFVDGVRLLTKTILEERHVSNDYKSQIVYSAIYRDNVPILRELLHIVKPPSPDMTAIDMLRNALANGSVSVAAFLLTSSMNAGSGAGSGAGSFTGESEESAEKDLTELLHTVLETTPLGTDGPLLLRLIELGVPARRVKQFFDTHKSTYPPPPEFTEWYEWEGGLRANWVGAVLRARPKYPMADVGMQ